MSAKITTITDYITGKEIPNVGSEENRQVVEKFLVEDKGFSRKDIEIDADIEMIIAGEPYTSQVDLVVSCEGKRLMLIKCVAASLGSREREIVSAARLLDVYQIPFSIVSDGNSAIIMDTISGKVINEGMDNIPSRDNLKKQSANIQFISFPEEKRERETLIFRTYDIENINVSRNIH
ncbi:MAG: type I restriction enzyme HsdR N-terminal domain-containing protein [Desulfobacterales bacterium]|nr:type I restriction enzyme HsdR N-terminal domain-containing protein [Desulfobacterales bacterium]